MNFEEFEANDEIQSQIDTVLYITTRFILDETPASEFLEWAQQSIPVIAPLMFEHIPPDEIPQVAYWFGVKMWNAAPQVSHHFKPTPLPLPGRNDPCPCGSGRKFKQCCIHMPSMPDFSTDTFWTYMAGIMSKSSILEYIREHQLPTQAIAVMAAQFADQYDYQQVIKMLDPLFEGQAPRINHKYSGLLDMLCDAYNAHYKTDRKKADLLQRMTHHADRVIRAEAWQRLASWRQDQGDNRGAREALNEAMRADPNNPSHSLLELSLLMSDGHVDMARERAKFWVRKLQHYENEFPGLIDILKQAQRDPVAALQQSTTPEQDDRLERLLHWIETINQQPLPEYQLKYLNEFETGQDDLFGENNSPPKDDPLANSQILVAPTAIQQLEHDWSDITPVEKPFSTQTIPFDAEDIWADPDDDEWLDFIETHPEAAGSLDILDDIVSLCVLHPNNQFPWGPLHQLRPLLEHAVAIIDKATQGQKPHLAWLVPENRPPLRLMAHIIYMTLESPQLDQANPFIERYIELNPEDNHGFRTLLINHYLQHNENEKALELANQYPEDIHAEIAYGRVLALYRLGQTELAEQALQKATDRLPLVAEYLIKAKIRKPKLDEHGFTIGGKDQAWFYREDMRDTWKATPEALQWLITALSSKTT